MELLPCPFCGGEAEVYRVGNAHTKKRSVVVDCKTSGCTIKMTVGVIHQSLDWAEGKAIEKWNTRLPINVKE